MDKNRTTTKKGKKRKIKLLLIISVTLFLIASGYGAFVFFKVKGAIDNSTVNLERKGNKSELRDDAIIFGKDPISILILGIENYSSKSKNGRADSQMVITLDPNSNEINMITVPRDTRVNIENAGEYTGIHKINAAYTYGSITGYGAAKLQIETVEKLLNIPIDHFVAMNFDGFRDIVDALGGVTIDIKKGFWETNFYNKKKIEFKQGSAHLNGEEALAFVRMRKRAVDASYSRDERQRQFLKSTVDQAISAETIFKIGQIADILGKNIETDLNTNEIYALQNQYTKIKNLSVKTIEIGGDDRTVDGSSYFIPEEKSLNEVSQKLRSILQLEVNSNLVTNADIVK